MTGQLRECFVFAESRQGSWKRIQREADGRGYIFSPKRQNDHMYSVGKNAATADCWDIDHGSLVSCSFL